MLLGLAFMLEAGDPKSGPHACMASTLATEPSPQLQTFLPFKQLHDPLVCIKHVFSDCTWMSTFCLLERHCWEHWSTNNFKLGIVCFRCIRMGCLVLEPTLIKMILSEWIIFANSLLFLNKGTFWGSSSQDFWWALIVVWWKEVLGFCLWFLCTEFLKLLEFIIFLC